MDPNVKFSKLISSPFPHHFLFAFLAPLLPSNIKYADKFGHNHPHHLISHTVPFFGSTKTELRLIVSISVQWNLK